jgi:alkylhydroperoxidase/carboxymuconolactone decarboxylase family protein YurZ
MSTQPLAPETEALLERMRADRGDLPDKFRTVAELDPGLLELFHATYMDALGDAGALTDRERQLILVAVDAATYFSYGCKFHIAAALDEGGTVPEVVEALKLAGLVGGFHVPMTALGLLDEVLKERAEGDGNA